MSFFGKFKAAATPQSASGAQSKKDPNAPQPTPLEKHLADVTGPVRPDGSDKFFGFENYGSTCYCNSIIQCLYYSAPFREHVINFPSKDFIDELATGPGGDPKTLTTPRNTSTTPYPNPTSPARKEAPPTSPTAVPPKPEEAKDSPDNRKKQAIKSGPVLAMTDDNSNKYYMDESLFTSLREIFEAIITNDSRTGVVSPHRFLEILRRENEMFRSAMHQDAHEFLNLLLNQVVDNVEMFSKQHPTRLAPPQLNGSAPEMKGSSDLVPAKSANGIDTHWVHDLFEGLLTSETRCLTCENTSQRDEAFLDLSVDLEPHTSVTSCLRKFSEEEMLCERNKFHCDNCGGLQEAEKRMKIKRLPRILALHLKRFKYTEDLQRLQKVFHKVVYPFHLRLFNTTDETDDSDRIYELYSVVVHIGGGPYHGHYVSIVKTEDRGWLLFDDELVEPVDKNFVLSFFGGEPVPGLQDAKQLACAYVLFYQETTLEAVLKEQEMEGQHHASAPAAARTSDVDAAKDLLTPLSKDPHTTLATTPLHEDLEHMDHLSHAVTAPALGARAATADDLTNTPTFNPIMPVKSKKELKVEEKERKAKEKADKKLEEQKRKEASDARMKVWREQNEQFKRTLEESKVTAAEEAKHRGEEESSGAAGSPEKMTGLSRFRTGSMSLRNKPKLFGRDKSHQVELSQPKDSTPIANGGLPSVPQGQELPDDTSGNGLVLEKTTSNHATALPIPPSSQAPDEKKKIRHRFSLSRKKSQAM